MLIGYIRNEEEKRLRAAGCQFVTPDLSAALARLVPGDTLVITRLDRLDMTSEQLLAFLHELFSKKRASLRSLEDSLDTSGPYGSFLSDLLGRITQADAAVKRERKLRGVKAAQGKQTGRPPVLSEERIRRALYLIARKEITASAAINLLGVSKSTFYRWRKARLTK